MIQISCFVQDGRGHLYMQTYDTLPFDARKRLQNSKYNLCTACLMTWAAATLNIHVAITYMEGTLDGHNMENYLRDAMMSAQSRGWRAPHQYIPEYWNDMDIDTKVKRDWYTQRMDKYNTSYRLMTSIIKPTDYF